jgi:hypothetical protein
MLEMCLDGGILMASERVLGQEVQYYRLYHRAVPFAAEVCWLMNERKAVLILYRLLYVLMKHM